MAAKQAYGTNPNAGVNPNLDRGWGNYQWPKGVPAALLAWVTDLPGGTPNILIRRELAPSLEYLLRIAHRLYGWAPSKGWTGGYDNRPIAGTSTPSNHSKAKAVDFDARNNPMSLTWQTDIPPQVVALFEAHGWYWGGRYTGKTDTMHFEFIGTISEAGTYERRLAAMWANVAGIPSNTPQAPATGGPVTGADGNWPLPPGHHFGPGGVAAIQHDGTANVYESRYVQEIQSQLKGLGYGPNLVDGDYGPKTRASVLAWQERNPGGTESIIQSGLIGLNDYRALHTYARVPHSDVAPRPTAPAYPGNVLRRGDVSTAVLTMQQQLQRVVVPAGKAFDYTSAPGTFGPRTEDAVRWFQTARHIEVDGAVGPQTWSELWK